MKTFKTYSSRKVSSLTIALTLLLYTNNVQCNSRPISITLSNQHSLKSLKGFSTNISSLSSLRGGSSPESPLPPNDPPQEPTATTNGDIEGQNDKPNSIEVTVSLEENVNTPVESSSTPPPPTTTTSIINNPKLKNAIERTGPALLMLFLLYLLIKHTGENGLIFLMIPLMQFGMYKETTGIIENYYNQQSSSTQQQRGKYNFDLEVNIEKWWWFATFFISSSGRLLLTEMQKIGSIQSAIPPLIVSILNSKDKMDLICFGMVSVGLVLAVVGMATHVDSNAERFRSYLGEMASFHFVLVCFCNLDTFYLLYSNLILFCYCFLTRKKNSRSIC